MKIMKVVWRIALLVLLISSLSGCEKYINEITNETNSGDVQAEQILPDPPAVSAEDILMAEEKDISIKNNEIAFSKTKHFYSESIEVEILSDKPGKIYYTLDGSDPTDQKQLYESPIKIDSGNKMLVKNIKAKAFYDDGTESNTITHTYFVGNDIANRFDTLIFSVSTDPYNLYDYEYGIFVEGKLRADFLKENPGVRPDPDDPANFNMRGREAERGFCRGT